jgi:DtxR family Mn-dependent transcriptional regulator
MEDHREHIIDELLESLYKIGEEGRLPVELHSLNLTNPPSMSDLANMAGRQLIVLRDDSIDLLPFGRKSAEFLIRRHRLGECLFSLLLELDNKSMNSASCAFEHILDPQVTESLCRVLGHPRKCPHGKAIPTGYCCLETRAPQGKGLIPLSELPPKSRGKIIFLKGAPKGELSHVIQMGMVPGRLFGIDEKNSVILINIDERKLAIDRNMADLIFVKPL